MGILTELDQQLQTVNVAAADDTTLRELMRRVRAGQRFLEGQTVRLARRASELEAEGSGRPASEVLLGAGEVSGREARRAAKRAELADQLPALGGTIEDGSARPENVDAVVRATTDLDDNQRQGLLAIDREVADRAANLPPETFQKWIRRRVDAITTDHGLSRFEQQRQASRVSTWVRGDGMHCLLAQLDPERGAAIHTAIEAETKALARAANEGGQPTQIDDRLRAEATYRVLTTGSTAGSSTPRVAISVITDHRTLASGPHPDSVSELWNGRPLPPHTLGRLCCNAELTNIEIDNEGLPMRVGNAHRTATPAQRKALRSIYDACPISRMPFDRCEIHHIDHGNGSHRTDLDNLIPLSVEWHHRMHEGHWNLTIDQDRTLHLHRPDGALDRTIPPPTPLTRRHRRRKQQRADHDEPDAD